MSNTHTLGGMREVIIIPERLWDATDAYDRKMARPFEARDRELRPSRRVMKAPSYEKH